MTQRSAIFILLTACFVSGSLSAAETINPKLPEWAPKPPPNAVEDRFRAEVMLLGASFDTKLRIDPSVTEEGTEISAEDDLKLDESQWLMQAELTLLPGEHHLVRLSGLSTRRSASTIIDEEIVFDDEIYEPGERVDSTLNLNLFGLTYGYRILVRNRGELTATFGIQVAQVDANALVRRRVTREAESGVSPLPLAGLEGRFDFTPHFSVEARVQYLSADIEEVKGTITDGRIAFTWRANPYLVLGLGYRSFSVDIDSKNEDTPGLVNMKIAGPMLFGRASL